MFTMTQVTGLIAAIGALGTAAFGLVDACKVFGGGISLAGFKFIRREILILAPKIPALDQTGLSVESIQSTLQSQWINGTATADQVNMAKSLVKLRLTRDTAAALAQATAVDPVVLGQVASKISTGTTLTDAERDVYGRFDLMLTTLLDQAYQRADQRYRNAAKAAAVPVAVILAVAANWFLNCPIRPMEAFVVGLVATPIAPIAKDVASAINTAAQAVQAAKKV